MKQLTIILFVIISFWVTSQEKDSNRIFIFSPGISCQKEFFTDISFLYGSHIMESGAIGIWGFKFGVESNFSNSNFIYAPKIGYELSFLNMTFRGSLLNLRSNNRSEFRLLPEISVTSFIILTLTYGYAIPLQKREFNEISSHRFSLTLNLDRKLWKAFF